MIRLKRAQLTVTAKAVLARYQRFVDSAPDYAARVARAKVEFARRNRASNQTFVEVRVALGRMCSGSRRCCYCEDSAADEVEHIRPKDLYPESVFVWSNYVYACGPCNGPKSNRFAVLSGATLRDVTRRPREPVVPPARGRPALINPRTEDPLRFMSLDLIDTFWFVPSAPVGTIERLRAEYTIQVLHLNDRDVLSRARREAFEDYFAHVAHYRAERDSGVPISALRQLRATVRARQHPTVWAEMKRQHTRVPRLAPLFAAAPEVLTW